MRNFATPSDIINVWIMIILLYGAEMTYSQTTDSAKQFTHFAGSAGITNNGISVVPTFSFDKPSATFLASIGKKG